MNEVAKRLAIKYGLDHRPGQDEVRRWRDEARRCLQEGRDPEEAGRFAASKVFSDFGTVIFKAEADTIEALLRAAEEK